jgi:hypothetical protein
MIILYQEEGNVCFRTISRRCWVNHRVSPKTGEMRKPLRWWLVPLVLQAATSTVGLAGILDGIWVGLLPFIAEPGCFKLSALFVQDIRPQLVGSWDLAF